MVAGSGATLRRRDCMEVTDTSPPVCAPGVQSLRTSGRRDRANGMCVMGLLSTLCSCSWLGWQLGEVNTYDVCRLLYILIQSSFLSFIEIFDYLP